MGMAFNGSFAASADTRFGGELIIGTVLREGEE
jgi:hypothetical protein